MSGRKVVASVGCPLCGSYGHTADVCPRRATVPPPEDAHRVIQYGLCLAMYGENAPGGTETWAGFGRLAEDYLRREGCGKRGFHTPDDPTCPECKRLAGVEASRKLDGS